MHRVYSCFEGHPARFEVTPFDKRLVCCVSCGTVTRQYNKLADAVLEWNYSDSPMWRGQARYELFGFDCSPIYRWWKGRFVSFA